MTDDDRKEAERVCPYEISSDNAFIWAQGFAAACETKREPLLTSKCPSCKAVMMLTCEGKAVEAERARATNLIHRLVATRTIDSWSKIWNSIQDAIAEYEKSGE